MSKASLSPSDDLDDEQASPVSFSAPSKGKKNHAEGTELKNSGEPELTEEEDEPDPNDKESITQEVEKVASYGKGNSTFERPSAPRKTTPSESPQQKQETTPSKSLQQKQKTTLSESPQQKQKTTQSESPHQKPLPSSSIAWLKERLLQIAFVLIAVVVIQRFIKLSSEPDPSSYDEDWRLKVDPNNRLPAEQRFEVFASLKPLLDRPSSNLQEKVYTLLILSPKEETAAKLGRCLLQRVNSATNIDQLPTEIDLQSYVGNKVALDSNLQTLLTTTKAIRAVLLRGIDNMPSKNELDRLTLLFAYCDGINPVIEDRLIIMTAASNSKTENELRQNFKARLPGKYDFIDPLMSRISGHTVYIDEDQESIC